MFTHLSSHKQTIIRRTFIKQYFYRKTTTKIICYFNNAIEEKWIKNGKLHCSGDVPAYIEYYKNGQNYNENWYKNDKRHRIRNVQFKCNDQQIK